MATFLAASTTSVPFGTVTTWPSMVRVTRLGSFGGWTSSGTGGHLQPLRGAHLSQAVLLVLLAEVAHRGHDHPAGRVPEAAEPAAVLQAVLDPVQDLQVDGAALVGQDASVGADRPVAADPAGGALPARLVGVEPEQP